MACSKRPTKAPHLSCILDDWLAGATFKHSLAEKKGSFCRPSRGWQNRKRQTQKAFRNFCERSELFGTSARGQNFSELLREVRTFRNFCERSELSLLRGHGWGEQDPPAWQTGWGWCFASQITLLLTRRVGMLLHLIHIPNFISHLSHDSSF